MKTDQIKDGEMNGSCGVNGKVAMQSFGGENIKGRTG
jgi:hypothetical protein